jgi:hypothetical protein
MPVIEVRRVEPPLTEAMVAPLEPECRSVHIGGPLTDSDAARVGRIMRPRPEVKLTVFSPHSRQGEITEVGFLRFLPWLEWLSVESRELQSLDGVAHLHRLRTLRVTSGLNKLCLEPLTSLAPSLRHLTVEGPVSRAGALSQLTGLITLTLRSVSMPDLSLLTPMTNLRGLDLKLGGTKDLSLLPTFTQLQYFEAWMIRGLSDLSPLADVTSLEELHLESLKHVSELPPLRRLIRLRRIILETMSGLTDLSVLLTAPALEEVTLRLPHLQPEQITQLAAHPGLKRATVGMGSDWKNDAVRAGLPLPPVASPSLYLALKQDHRATSTGGR